MNLVTLLRSDELVIRVDEQRIDAAVAIRFKDRMRELAADGPARVILDLTHVEFIDSSGLGALVAVMKFLRPERELELAGIGANVGRVLRLTRMDSVLTIHATVPGESLLSARAQIG